MRPAVTARCAGIDATLAKLHRLLAADHHPPADADPDMRLRARPSGRRRCHNAAAHRPRGGAASLERQPLLEAYARHGTRAARASIAAAQPRASASADARAAIGPARPAPRQSAIARANGSERNRREQAASATSASPSTRCSRRARRSQIERCRREIPSPRACAFNHRRRSRGLAPALNWSSAIAAPRPPACRECSTSWSRAARRLFEPRPRAVPAALTRSTGPRSTPRPASPGRGPGVARARSACGPIAAAIAARLVGRGRATSPATACAGRRMRAARAPTSPPAGVVRCSSRGWRSARWPMATRS